MSRTRSPSARFLRQVVERSTTQAQAAASVMQASNTAVALEAVEAVATDLAANLATISDTLADYGNRLNDLETP